ncbi:hypothetical protein DFA_12262 [Cavenderia fasciculata]|uniref:Uncharacterized protein n=1 Tax=Cavenderia fasciculata TaxID=261658 RepID=F4QCW4_CACFS|nr:uncharacterized protein DFA_12262 [Cavenderia fasciculata]EGG14488.1 hypothetical protein DFA_12262 [Cavenderia fasciculata]|eukprot:XP_004353897.1 hypothetical protein DFA_12262 [Cavenderia fasciculata]
MLFKNLSQLSAVSGHSIQNSSIQPIQCANRSTYNLVSGWLRAEQMNLVCIQKEGEKKEEEKSKIPVQTEEENKKEKSEITVQKVEEKKKQEKSSQQDSNQGVISEPVRKKRDIFQFGETDQAKPKMVINNFKSTPYHSEPTILKYLGYYGDAFKQEFGNYELDYKVSITYLTEPATLEYRENKGLKGNPNYKDVITLEKGNDHRLNPKKLGEPLSSNSVVRNIPVLNKENNNQLFLAFSRWSILKLLTYTKDKDVKVDEQITHQAVVDEQSSYQDVLLEKFVKDKGYSNNDFRLYQYIYPKYRYNEIEQSTIKELAILLKQSSDEEVKEFLSKNDGTFFSNDNLDQFKRFESDKDQLPAPDRKTKHLRKLKCTGDICK